jgi:hypothetical protein
MENDRFDLQQENQNTAQKNKIVIGDQSKINGVICYLKPETENIFTTNILINKGCVLKGEIYCEGNLELYGQLFGSVYTHQFIVNQYGSIYINHLFNAQINSLLLHEKYSGILFETTFKGIAKWMY